MYTPELNGFSKNEMERSDPKRRAMKGDLSRKKSILKNLADDIEPDRQNLREISKGWTESMFQMFHKFVRHNNSGNSVMSV